MTGPLLEAVSVTRRFGGFTAVADVSMSVAAGEVVGLLGANGAGKTTLIRMVLGLLSPTSGDVRVLGRWPTRDVRRELGYVPQGLGLYDDLTVAENLDFVADAYAVPRARAAVPQDLAEHARTLVGALALGTQRQVAFACALLHDPRVLVLDEPTSGVDPLARARLWDTIHEQADAGIGVLVTTHYMQEAEQCDRLLLMSDGVLVAQGSEADVVGGTTATEVVCDNWAAAFSALQSAGAPVMLAGRSVRVADGDPEALRAALAAAGLHGEVRQVPATIEERMAVLARR